MWLKIEPLKEVTQEGRAGKAETAKEVGNKNNVLARVQYRGELRARKSAFDFGGNTPRLVKPLDVGLSDAGTLPSCPIYMKLIYPYVGSGRTRDEIAAGTHVFKWIWERTRVYSPRNGKGQLWRRKTEKEIDLCYKKI